MVICVCDFPFHSNKLFKGNLVKLKIKTLVKGLNDVAVGLAEQNQPLSLILSANPSNTGADTTEGRQIALNKIPSCICESSRSSCIFGQAHHEKISTMPVSYTHLLRIVSTL